MNTFASRVVDLIAAIVGTERSSAAAMQENVALHRGATMRLEGGRGTQVRVTRGCVWITQHADHEDHVLRAGDCLALNGFGATLVQALEPSAVGIATPRTARHPFAIGLVPSARGAS